MSLAAAPARVFMTADAVGGVWTYALDLAEGLSRSGCAVTLAALGPALDLGQRLEADRIEGLQLVETGLPLDWTADRRDQVRAAGIRIADLAVAAGADLVHLNSPALAAGAGFSVPVVGACHSCLATWWEAVRGGRPPADFGWRIELLAEGYAACDGLIAPSAAFAEATRRRYGVTPRVVRNGRRAQAVETGRERRRVAFAAGRLWDEGKGAATLEAAARLARTSIEAAGPTEGPLGQAVRLEAAIALGRLDAEAVAERMADSLIFVSPALYEPFGLSVLEAAQAGCALVLADIPTLRELWEGAALFVSPGAPEALAAAVDGLAADQAACARLAGAARRRAATYSLDAMVERTLAVYGETLSRAVPARAEAVA